MKVLVTGADGLLGSNLVRMLLNEDYEVRVFLHPSSKSNTLDGLAIEKTTGDILKPETIDAAMDGIDIIVHAAANTNVWPARSEIIRRVNIEGTQNMVDAAFKYKVKRFVFVGSGSSVNSTDPNSKYAFPGQKFGLDYIDSKFEALNLVMDASRNSQLPALAILPTFMIGPYDSLPSSGKVIQAIVAGKLKYYSNGGRNFVYVKDVAQAIINAIGSPLTGKYYIAGHENMKYKDYLTMAAEIVNMPPPKLKLPNWLILTAGRFGTLIGKISGKAPMISYEVARISCDVQYTTSEEAVRDLNMPQTPVSQAIEECYSWFKENDYV